MIKIAKMRPMAERPLEYYTGTAGEEIILGEALVLSDGTLTKCGATTTPEFISMGSGRGVVIPVVRVMEEDVYSAPIITSGASLNVGDKVTLAATADAVTATTTSGVFEITQINGTSVGDTVLGIFRR